jgi:phospholipid/cholesterol/gamma-HCH transport system substrate-binding protein
VKIRAEATKLTIFILVGAFAFVLLYKTLAQQTIGGHPSIDYSAVMDNVSGLKSGDLVKIAGVRVGQVSGLDVMPGNQIKVHFSVAADEQVTDHTGVAVRYLDLLGNRYLQLSQLSAGGTPLQPGATIPEARTSPALDLSTLLNGFQPLFQGLQPDQINQLATGIIRTLQGEGGTIPSLLAQTASLTNGLADRDQAIGAVMTNLDSVLGTLDAHDTQFKQAVIQLKDLVSGLASTGSPISAAAANISQLAATLGTFFAQVKSPLAGTLAQMDVLATMLNKNSGRLNATLNLLPKVYNTIDRVASHGSFFNFYLCSVQVLAGSSSKPVSTPVVRSTVPRCN